MDQTRAMSYSKSIQKLLKEITIQNYCPNLMYLMVSECLRNEVESNTRPD